MTTQELKQQARKEFMEDERFEAITRRLGWYESDSNNIKIAPATDDPRPEILSFLDSLIDRTVQATEERIVDLIINAGQNRISMLDPELPRCEACLNGFTGTYWISQNDIIFSLTGSYLSDYKDKIISKK